MDTIRLKRSRPSFDTYFMEMAQVVSRRSTCIRRSVGAVLVYDNHIISTGYNGTIAGAKHCTDGGCARCSSETVSGDSLDECVCVHAEANALLFAARCGHATDGSTLVTLLQPCLSCLKLCIQAGVVGIVYKEAYQVDTDAYNDLVLESDIVLLRYVLDLPTPRRG